MKKIFCAAIILAAAYTVSAQEVVMYKTTTNEFDYSSQVPASIRANFQASYPAATTVTWMPMTSDWWYATYKTDNNRIVRVYYNTQPWYMMRGESFRASLPVLNTYVPTDVITNAINTYGNNLYSITRRLSNGNEDVYHVTIIKNGKSEISLMNGQGVVYTDVNKIQSSQH
ncbi:MAG TPA: hypothetical protein VKB95_14240 [Chitinophagaceae bacterium]|nr:hypothetical protein [Chitinophagaceae bacterium]